MTTPTAVAKRDRRNVSVVLGLFSPAKHSRKFSKLHRRDTDGGARKVLQLATQLKFRKINIGQGFCRVTTNLFSRRNGTQILVDGVGDGRGFESVIVKFAKKRAYTRTFCIALRDYLSVLTSGQVRFFALKTMSEKRTVFCFSRVSGHVRFLFFES